MQITLIHPKNELCRLVIRVLHFFGIDASESKYLTKTEFYENTGISEIVMTSEFGEYFARFYGSLTPRALDGGDSAPSQAESTPEDLSDLLASLFPPHRQ